MSLSDLLTSSIASSFSSATPHYTDTDIMNDQESHHDPGVPSVVSPVNLWTVARTIVISYTVPPTHSL